MLLPAGAEANDRAAAWMNAGDNRLRLRWQGKHGRVASFYESLWRVLYHWEWDSVDSTVLLNQCANPVVFELLWITMLPQLCLLMVDWQIPDLSSFARIVLVRTVLGSAFLYEIVTAFKEELSSWFTAAHQTARDDRYLIGRILLNYDETTAGQK